MRSSRSLKKGVFSVLIFLITFTATFLFGFFDGRIFTGEKRQRTPQGDVLSLMHTHYGAYKTYKPPSLKRWLVQRLPLSSAQKFKRTMEMGTTWSLWETGDSASDALWFWFSLKQVGTLGREKVSASYQVELIDSHGWVYRDTRFNAFVWQSIVPKMGVCAFQNVPRHDPFLHLRVYHLNGSLLGEFEVENPLFIETSPTVEAPSFPVPQRLGNTRVSLTGIKEGNMTGGPFLKGGDLLAHHPIQPLLQFESDGDSIEQWDLVDMVLRDEDGNLSTSANTTRLQPSLWPLSPYQDVWRWGMRFVEQGRSETKNEHTQHWHASEMLIPEENAIAAIQQEQSLGGVHVKVLACAGPGAFLYELDEDAISKTFHVDHFKSLATPGQKVTWNKDFNPQNGTVTVESAFPHLVIELSGLSDAQRLSAHWIDNRGKGHDLQWHDVGSIPKELVSRYYGKPPRTQSSNRTKLQSLYIPLEKAKPGQSGHVRFTLHDVQHLTFEFQPDPAWFKQAVVQTPTH